MKWQEKYLKNLMEVINKDQPRWPKGHPQGGQWKSIDSIGSDLDLVPKRSIDSIGSEIPSADAMSDDNIMKQGVDISEALFGDPSYYNTRAPDHVVTAYKNQVESKLQERLKDNEDYQYFKENFNKLDPTFPSEEFSGISLERKLVSKWAQSSGDDHTIPVFMQDMAREEFGLDSASSIHFGRRARDELDQYAFRKDLDHVKFENGAKAFLREMYNETQQSLADAGIKEVVLLRGWGDTALKKSKDMKKTVIKDAHWLGNEFDIDIYEGQVRTQPMSSFAYAPGSADLFSFTSSPKKSVITATKVPASKILSTPASGYGCLREHEMVVLGSKLNTISVAVPVKWQDMKPSDKLGHIEKHLRGK
jgi:hypothetical protein